MTTFRAGLLPVLAPSPPVETTDRRSLPRLRRRSNEGSSRPFRNAVPADAAVARAAGISARPAASPSTLGAFGCAVALPWTPLAPWLRFAPLAPTLLAVLAGVVVVYLVVVDVAKRRLFERHGLA